MAHHGDLPGWLSAVHPRYQVPHPAEIALSVVVSVLVMTVDLRGVLVYYAIANTGAFSLRSTAAGRAGSTSSASRGASLWSRRCPGSLSWQDSSCSRSA